MPTAPYGSWSSPLTARLIAAGATQLAGVASSDGRLYWSEQRPSEGGRTVIVTSDGDVTPAGFNVRTQVHEYGGGAWWLNGSTLYFANWDDQRLYRQEPGAAPVPITPEPEIGRGLRYADGIVTRDGRAIVCVRERHVRDREAYNEIVSLPTDGSSASATVIGGNDFYSNPRISPDGSQICWLEWSHPNLPWDGTFLYLADLTPEYGIRNTTLVAGAMDES